MPDAASGPLAFSGVLEACGLTNVEELGRVHPSCGSGGRCTDCGRIRTVQFRQRNHLVLGSLAEARTRNYGGLDGDPAGFAAWVFR